MASIDFMDELKRYGGNIMRKNAAYLTRVAPLPRFAWECIPDAKRPSYGKAWPNQRPPRIILLPDNIRE